MLIRLAPLASMPPRATEGSTHHSRGQYGSAFRGPGVCRSPGCDVARRRSAGRSSGANRIGMHPLSKRKTMQLMRIGNAGHERPAVRDEQGRYFDVSPLTSDIDGAFLGADGVARVRAALAVGELPEIELGDTRIGSPIARPMAVLCIGQNYAAHAAESGAAPPETAHPVLQTSQHGRGSLRRRDGASGLVADGLGGRARCRDRPSCQLPTLSGRGAQTRRRAGDLQRRVRAGVPD